MSVEGNAIEGSLRITILFFGRLFDDGFPFIEVPGREDCECCDSSASASACLNQPIPNWYGFASGDPFILSILSSFLGSRICGGSLLPPIPDGALLFGNLGVLGGKDGLKLELEGTRLVGCDGCDLPVLGFVGDAGRDAGRDEVVKGGLDFVGLGDAGIRETVFDCKNESAQG